VLQGLAAGGLEWTAEHAGLAPIRSIVQWILRQCIKVIVRGTLESILTARAQLFNKTFIGKSGRRWFDRAEFIN
jgi:hypothetical protein